MYEIPFYDIRNSSHCLKKIPVCLAQPVCLMTVGTNNYVILLYIHTVTNLYTVLLFLFPQLYKLLFPSLHLLGCTDEQLATKDGSLSLHRLLTCLCRGGSRGFVGFGWTPPETKNCFSSHSCRDGAEFGHLVKNTNPPQRVWWLKKGHQIFWARTRTLLLDPPLLRDINKYS